MPPIFVKGIVLLSRNVWSVLSDVKRIFSEDTSPLLNTGICSMVFSSLIQLAYNQIPDFRKDGLVGGGLWFIDVMKNLYGQPIYIGGAKHVPLSVEAMRDVMPVLFELLEEEPEASVRAVLGHFIFVFIHPYGDGNGRMGRLLMNSMLASGGYPWTVIPVERRQEYMKALESASVSRDIGPFAGLIADLVSKSLNGKPEANLDHAHHE